MFGIFSGRADRENAQIVHMYLTTFHRTFNRMGVEFMLNMIKTNPLVTDFTDFKDYKIFFVKENITDFQFTFPTLPMTESKPVIIAAGRHIYRGISAHVNLETGRTALFPVSSLDHPPTQRAIRFAKEFDALAQQSNANGSS